MVGVGRLDFFGPRSYGHWVREYIDQGERNSESSLLRGKVWSSDLGTRPLFSTATRSRRVAAFPFTHYLNLLVELNRRTTQHYVTLILEPS